MTQIPSYLDLPVGPTPTPRMISEATPEKEDLGTPSFMDVFEDVSVTARILDYFYSPSKPDPNFRISPDYLEKYGRNLPANLVEKLADSESEEEFLYRYRTMRDRLKTQEKLANMGLTGMAYQFGVAMVDPAFLVAAPLAGLAIGSRAVAAGVTATRTVRAQAAMRGLGISAAVDVPLEGVRWVMDPLTDGQDFVINTLASMGMGTGLSAAFPSMAGFKSGWKKQVELERMRIAADVEKANLDEMLAAVSPENAAQIKETAQRKGLDTEGKETGEIVRELMAVEARRGPGTMGPFLSEEGTTRYINGLSKKDLFAEAKARGIETQRSLDTGKKIPRSAKELREELIAARRDDFEIENQSVTALITAINESSDELKDQLKLMRFSVEDYAKELSKEIPKESIFSRFINSGPKLKPLAVMARRSENERVRDFFSILVEDPTGSPRIDIETVVYANRQTAMGNYQKARLAIERRNGRKALKNFDANVAEAVRTGKKLDGLEGKAVQAVREFFGGLAAFAEESGIAGFRNFVDNNYVPRRAVARKVNEAIEKFGEVEVRRLLTNALRANNPDMADKKVSAVVNGWFKYSQDPNGYVNARVTGKNSQQKLDAMRGVLNRSNITKDEVEEILDFFIPKSNDPHLGMTNKRINFNEATSIEVAGKGVLKFSDLLDNDMTLLMEQYATRVLGSAELTKMAKALDIDVQGTGATVPTRQDMIAWMEKGEGGLSDEMKAGFEVAYNAIMGLSQGNLSDKSRRALRFLQDYAFIQSMGNVGIAQLPELGNSAVSNGIRATLQSVPRLRKLVRQAANGQLSDEVLEEIDSFVRAGDMLDEGFTRAYRIHDDVGLEESGLGDVGSGIRSTGKNLMQFGRTVASGAPISVAGRGISLNIKGIGPADELLRNGHTLATLQNWVNLAYRVKDGKKVTNTFWSKSRKRFEYLGFTDEETDTILEALADPNVTPVKQGLLGKSIVKLNLSAMDDGLRNKLVFALRRDVDRVIQRNKIGNLSPWMSHPMANVFLQFRKFALNATNKQLVYNLQMMDGKAGATFLSTALLGTLGYMVTTEIGALKFTGKELREYKEEAYGSKEFLGIEIPKLMIAGVIRSGMSGILPAIMSPISQVIDPEEEDIFNTYRTSGYGVDLFSFDNTPGGALITGGFRSSKELVAATLNAVSGGRMGNELTEPELRAILRLLPMRNTIIFNELSKALIEQANLPERQK